jgi:hypothetical protein
MRPEVSAGGGVVAGDYVALQSRGLELEDPLDLRQKPPAQTQDDLLAQLIVVNKASLRRLKSSSAPTVLPSRRA